MTQNMIDGIAILIGMGIPFMLLVCYAIYKTKETQK